MTKQLIEFKFHQNQIRSITDDQGNPWFVAKDVFAALDITWKGSDSVQHLPENWVKGSGVMGPLCDEKGVRKFRTLGGEQELITINEPAVYMIAFRSNKHEAIEFTEWDAGDVLPSIRKTGKYVVPGADVPKPKGGFSHLPTFITDADAGGAFAVFNFGNNLKYSSESHVVNIINIVLSNLFCGQYRLVILYYLFRVC